MNKLSILNGAKYFSLRIFQNYLVLILAKKYMKYFSSIESTENIMKSGSSFVPNFADHHLLQDMNFSGHYLIKNNISIPKKVINLYFLHNGSTINFYLQMEAIIGDDMTSSVHVDNTGKYMLILGA